jgi:hypothetical protein
VITGTGKKRHRVVRVVSLYRVVVHGVTDAKGHLKTRIKVTFHTKKSYQASLTATVSAGRKTLKATTHLTITPPRPRTHH